MTINDINVPNPETGRTRIFDAIESNDLSKAMTLVESGARLDIPDAEGNYPMHSVASVWATPKLVSYIMEESLKQGVSITQPNGKGYHALHIAMERGSSETSQILMEQFNASPDIPNGRGWLPHQLTHNKACLALICKHTRDPELRGKLEHDEFSLWLGERVSRQVERVHGYASVKPGTLFSKPTFLCLGGNNMNGPGDANGFAKLVQDLLGRGGEYDFGGRKIKEGIFNDEMCFISANYPKSDNTVMKDEYARFFVRDHLLPLIADNAVVDENGHVTGQKLPVETVQRHLRNINIFGFSQGAVAAQHIGNALYDAMQQLGYNENEIQQMTGQVLLVTLGNPTDIRQGKSYFKEMHFLHSRDMVASKDTHALVTQFRNERGLCDRAQAVLPYDFAGHRGCVISISRPTHAITYDNRERRGQEDRDHHSIELYTKYDEKTYEERYNPAVVPPHVTMLPMVLANGIMNSMMNRDCPPGEFTPLPDHPQRLLTPPTEILYAQDAEKTRVRTGPKLIMEKNSYTRELLHASGVATGQEAGR